MHQPKSCKRLVFAESCGNKIKPAVLNERFEQTANRSLFTKVLWQDYANTGGFY